MKMIAVFAAIIAVFVAVAVVRARHIGSKSPASGTPAPHFTLNSQDGKPLSLREFRGKWVVLYFYPKDFTSSAALGLHFLSAKHNISAEIRYMHISNAGLAAPNPGINTVQFRLGFSAFSQKE